MLVGLAAVVGLGTVVVAAGLAKVFGWFGYAVFQSVFPSTVSWDGKSAFVKCTGAIADASQWPKPPEKACAAMHMCANEATLSDTQTRALEQVVRNTPGCPEL